MLQRAHEGSHKRAHSDKIKGLHESISLYITISMRLHRRPSLQTRIRDEVREFIETFAAWLNGGRSDQGKYDLEDGTPFPYTATDEVLDQVRGWVRQLISSDWNLEKWREAHWDVWKEIERRLGGYRPAPILVSNRNGLRLDWSFCYERTDSVLPLDPHVWAFIRLVMNPERERLGLCERCNKFYVSKGRYRRKIFCSLHCARNATVSRYMSRRRYKLRQVKINHAKRLLHGYRSSHGDWKRWLSLETKGTEIELTPAFLTRAVSKGDLVNPLTEPGGKLQGTLKPGPRPEAKKS